MSIHFNKGLALLALCTLLSACGEDADKQTTQSRLKEMKEKHHAAFAMMKQRRLVHAVTILEANVSNVQGSGGYQMWTATKMADTLVRLSKTADAHIPGEPRVKNRMPAITYVKGHVTKPWQIVLIPDDKSKKILVKAYGDDIKKPAITKEIPVSTY